MGKHDAENGMKKRIYALQASEKKQQEAMRLQDEKKRKLAQELERVRIDSLKTRKAYERELEGCTLKLQKYEEQSISNGEIKAELETSLQEYLSKVDTLRTE